ncbi:MarR family transcriptional regulator [Gordoniibacillus kamchatkensis]|uniref:MarR family transcriptional regulator n=1 Tax=Gordoniibacillus kamchatkensis TaxID=1590651 RepID=A0ABR5AL98_9BACL|nr:MarR family transcriptional regulator [Paenibacillus sp. VKM B-2647]KIL41835.1 MarR family transcriptional regulator [Paenibacillus sp. VKM B-2647]
MDSNALFRKFVAFTVSVHEMTNEMAKEVRSEAITLVQYKILQYIAVSQPVTLSEISDCMHMSMPNTSRELKKLSEKQLCEKVADNEDRRKQFIRLSAKGEAMMNDAFQRIEARFAERVGAISPDEMKEIERALDLLRAKVFY